MSDATTYEDWRQRFPEASVPIRMASAKDAATWRSLWRGLALDQQRRGSDFVYSEKTLAFFEALFWSYVREERPGIVLLAGWDWGVLMWGAPLWEPPLDLRDGPVAQGWGTYVTPSLRRMGISKRLRIEAAAHLKEMGFARVTGSGVLPPGLAKRIQESLGSLENASLESGLGSGFVWESVQASLAL